MGKIIPITLGLAGTIVLAGLINSRLTPSTEPEVSTSPAAVVEPTTKPDPPKAGGKWSLSGGTSGFDDSPTVVISLKSEDTLSGWPSQTTVPSLVLRCSEGKTNAYINTGMTGRIAFGQYGADEGTDMRMRYDKGEVFQYRMAASTDKKAYFFSDPITEIKFILKHERMLVEFCPFNSSPQEFRFDIRKLDDILPELRKVCRW